MAILQTMFANAGMEMAEEEANIFDNGSPLQKGTVPDDDDIDIDDVIEAVGEGQDSAKGADSPVDKAEDAGHEAATSTDNSHGDISKDEDVPGHQHGEDSVENGASSDARQADMELERESEDSVSKTDTSTEVDQDVSAREREQETDKDKDSIFDRFVEAATNGHTLDDFSLDNIKDAFEQRFEALEDAFREGDTFDKLRAMVEIADIDVVRAGFGDVGASDVEMGGGGFQNVVDVFGEKLDAVKEALDAGDAGGFLSNLHDLFNTSLMDSLLGIEQPHDIDRGVESQQQMDSSTDFERMQEDMAERMNAPETDIASDRGIESMNEFDAMNNDRENLVDIESAMDNDFGLTDMTTGGGLLGDDMVSADIEDPEAAEELAAAFL